MTNRTAVIINSFNYNYSIKAFGLLTRIYVSRKVVDCLMSIPRDIYALFGILLPALLFR